MHNFVQSYKIVTINLKNCETTENCDSNFRKLWRYAKKVEEYFWFYDFAQFFDLIKFYVFLPQNCATKCTGAM